MLLIVIDHKSSLSMIMGGDAQTYVTIFGIDGKCAFLGPFRCFFSLFRYRLYVSIIDHRFLSSIDH